MKLLSMVSALGLILLVGLCISCGGSGDDTSPATAEKSVSETVDSVVDSAVEAADEAVADADPTMDKIKAEIAAKEDDLAKIADELKGLSPQDMVGEKGAELKAKSEALTAEIEELKAKLDSMM